MGSEMCIRDSRLTIIDILSWLPERHHPKTQHWNKVHRRRHDYIHWCVHCCDWSCRSTRYCHCHGGTLKSVSKSKLPPPTTCQYDRWPLSFVGLDAGAIPVTVRDYFGVDSTVVVVVVLFGPIITNSTTTFPLKSCLLYTSPSPRDLSTSRMPSSA